MNITTIKAFITKETGANITSLDMVRQFSDAIGGETKADGTIAVAGDKDAIKQPWLSHWDNTSRVRVTMHEDVFNKIRGNKLMEGLALKPKEVVHPEDNVKRYTRYIVITPNNIEDTF